MFINKMSKSAKPKIQLKKLKELDNKLWHPDSTLVFNDDKKVIGRFDGDFVALDDVSIELCVKWGFKYDESLLEDGTEEEEGSEEQAEREEGEGEEEEEEAEEEEAEEETEDQDSDEQEVHKPVIEKPKKVEEQKIIKEEIKIKQVESESENENETYITDLTSNFSNKLNTFFDEFRIKNNIKITNLQNELKELTEKYENEIKNHNDLKNKFNAVKSLFSG